MCRILLCVTSAVSLAVVYPEIRPRRIGNLGSQSQAVKRGSRYNERCPTLSGTPLINIEEEQ